MVDAMRRGRKTLKGSRTALTYATIERSVLTSLSGLKVSEVYSTPNNA